MAIWMLYSVNVNKEPSNQQLTSSNHIPLFHPNVPQDALSEVTDTLHSRWIGQGPKVELFEKLFSEKFTTNKTCIAVGSGTDALHLAYLLAGVEKDSEVLAPVFTCTATNIPFLYMGANVKFVDVSENSLNMDLEDLERKITPKTAAIVVVNYGGLPVDLDRLNQIASVYNVPVIQDSAHALGARYKNKHIADLTDFSIYSFQAIKHITTGDGGMLVINNPDLAEKAKRLRWFGIDRTSKLLGVWENDISEIGFKYQMNDISAGMGIAGIRAIDGYLKHRRELLITYIQNLEFNRSVSIIDAQGAEIEHAAWMFTIRVRNRAKLQSVLLSQGIESSQVHYRNDRYSVFGGRKSNLPNMDSIEDEYLVLPLHTKMTKSDVERVCSVINGGW